MKLLSLDDPRLATVPEPEIKVETYAPDFEFGTKHTYSWPNGFSVEVLACPNGTPILKSEILSAKLQYLQKHENTTES